MAFDAAKLKEIARDREQAGKIEEALALYRRVLGEIEGTVAEIQELPLYIKVGDLALKMGDEDGAFDSYDRAATGFSAQGDTAKVIALCLKAVRINNRYVGIYLRQARALLNHGHIEKARALLVDYARRGNLDKTLQTLEQLGGQPEAQVKQLLARAISSVERRVPPLPDRREFPRASMAVEQPAAAVEPPKPVPPTPTRPKPPAPKPEPPRPPKPKPEPPKAPAPKPEPPPPAKPEPPKPEPPKPEPPKPEPPTAEPPKPAPAPPEPEPFTVEHGAGAFDSFTVVHGAPEATAFEPPPAAPEPPARASDMLLSEPFAAPPPPPASEPRPPKQRSFEPVWLEPPPTPPAPPPPPPKSAPRLEPRPERKPQPPAPRAPTPPATPAAVPKAKRAAAFKGRFRVDRKTLAIAGGAVAVVVLAIVLLLPGGEPAPAPTTVTTAPPAPAPAVPAPSAPAVPTPTPTPPTVTPPPRPPVATGGVDPSELVVSQPLVAIRGMPVVAVTEAAPVWSSGPVVVQRLPNGALVTLYQIDGGSAGSGPSTVTRDGDTLTVMVQFGRFEVMARGVTDAATLQRLLGQLTEVRPRGR